MSLSVSKRGLWHYVNLKIKRLIHRHHVFAVISILFEEMIKDLRAGKIIKVANFGTIQLKEMLPRKYHHIILRKTMLSPGHKSMRISLDKKIKKKLSAEVELDNPKSDV